jgi:hypothetical protein
MLIGFRFFSRRPHQLLAFRLSKSCTAGKIIVTTIDSGRCYSGTTFKMVNFASTRYASAFENLPQPDRGALRQSTLDYLAAFDPQSWYNDPVGGPESLKN